MPYIDRWDEIGKYLSRNLETLLYAKLTILDEETKRVVALPDGKFFFESATSVDFWLSYPIDDLQDDPGVEHFRRQLGRPSAGPRGRLGAPDDYELGDDIDESDLPPGWGTPAGDKALDAADAEENKSKGKSKGKKTKAKEEEEESPPPDEDGLDINDYDREDRIEACRRWLHTLVHNNTPDDGLAHYRLYLNKPKGINSKSFTFSIHGASTTEDEYEVEEFEAGSIGALLGAAAQEQRAAPDGSDGVPANMQEMAQTLGLDPRSIPMTTPQDAQSLMLLTMQNQLMKMQHQKELEAAKKKGKTGKSAAIPYDIPTPLLRTHEGHSILTLAALHTAMRETLALNTNISREMLRMQNSALRAQSKALDTNRDQVDRLLEAIGAMRLEAAEIQAQREKTTTEEHVRQGIAEQGIGALKELAQSLMGAKQLAAKIQEAQLKVQMQNQQGPPPQLPPGGSGNGSRPPGGPQGGGAPPGPQWPGPPGPQSVGPTFPDGSSMYPEGPFDPQHAADRGASSMFPAEPPNGEEMPEPLTEEEIAALGVTQDQWDNTAQYLDAHPEAVTALSNEEIQALLANPKTPDLIREHKGILETLLGAPLTPPKPKRTLRETFPYVPGREPPGHGGEDGAEPEQPRPDDNEPIEPSDVRQFSPFRNVPLDAPTPEYPDIPVDRILPGAGDDDWDRQGPREEWRNKTDEELAAEAEARRKVKAEEKTRAQEKGKNQGSDQDPEKT